MKRGSTLFLKTAILLLGIFALGLCIFILPAGIMSDRVGFYRPILIGMYVPAVPFFVGLWQAFKLLTYVDKNEAFSAKSLRSLNIIKYCGGLIGLLYALALPYIYYAATSDDAPGVMLLGLIFTFAPLTIAVMAAVFQKQLKNVIEAKSENDLIV
jgi:hypothetical protein